MHICTRRMLNYSHRISDKHIGIYVGGVVDIFAFEHLLFGIFFTLSQRAFVKTQITLSLLQLPEN